MSEIAPSRTAANLGAHKTPRRLGPPLAWREVLGALQQDETRQAVVALYRQSGFQADDFGGRKARVAMVEILVSTEDALELEHPGRRVERDAIKAVRRRLEVEVDP